MQRARALFRHSLFVLILAGLSYAQGAAFDLSGPQLEVKITRAGKTLPISQVPNLESGDRLWLHPVLPDSQSVRFLLIVAFLRGTTDPPPESWFTKIETWNKAVRQEGAFVTIPKDAQQVLLLMAPETGGGFPTLRATVRGKPGAFVRASQDLMQASLDRLRLDKYLTEVKATSTYDPKALHDRSVLLARSLSIKLNQECFDRPVEEQSSCLTRNTDQLVLDDDHSQSMVATLTSGPNSDLIGQLSNTRIAGGGLYNAYIGAVVDVVRIMGNLHTAEYRYIPALALPKKDTLDLRLNNPPSFRKPKSVIVIGLPPVQPPSFPPLRRVDPNMLFCLQKPSLVLPAEGSPAIFASDYGHDLVLHLQDNGGASADLPVTPDATRGGLIVDVRDLPGEKLDFGLTGTLQGKWGFQSWEGPTFQLRNARPTNWLVASADPKSLIVGRDDTLRLQSEATACVNEVTTAYPDGREFKSDWKALGRDEVEIQVPLKDAVPGPITVQVRQFGAEKPDQIPLQTFAEAASVERLMIHAGDQQGLLDGSRLDQVKAVELRGLLLSPGELVRVNQKDQLRLSATNPIAASGLHPGEQLIAHVTLVDGRILDLTTKIEAPRPSLQLLSKSIQENSDSTATPTQFHMGNKDDLPQEARLAFFVKAEIPQTFPRTQKIEVAAVDGSFHTLLSIANGDLVLQDSQTVLAVLDPRKSFGISAFGPLRFRPVDGSGTEGDWQPLMNLVRVPSLKEVRCPEDTEKPCTLSGSNLFLLDSVATNAEFTRSVSVPIAYADSTLTVPHPNGTQLYIKLRDDPSAVNRVVVPVVAVSTAASGPGEPTPRTHD